MPVPPMQPGCPWSDVANAWLPNLKWCEAQRCSWIVEPANTWSNLAYIAVGLWLLWQAAQRGDSIQRTFGRATLAVGSCSFLYHASWTGVLQILDFAGMYIFLGLPLSFNAERLGWLAPERRGAVYAWGICGLTVVTVLLRFTPFPIQAIVGVLILMTLATEWALRGRDAVSYQPFFVSLGLLTVGTAFSTLDATRAWCEPGNVVLQGHALWHVFTALSLLAVSRFYGQLSRFRPALALAAR
jgi:hypothetical protein